MSRSGKKDQQKGGKRERTTADWIALALSSLIILAVVGAVAYSYIIAGELPANIAVELHRDKVERLDGEYYLPLTIRNTGSKVAEEVEVSVIHRTQEGREESDFSVRFLPGGGDQRAFASFESDPRQGELMVDVEGYLVP